MRSSVPERRAIGILETPSPSPSLPACAAVATKRLNAAKVPMWSRGCWDSRCSADSESGRCSSASWMTRAPGTGRRLVLHGEPGVGKTALLDLAVELGDGLPGRSHRRRRRRDRSCPTPRSSSSSAPIFELSARACPIRSAKPFPSRSVSSAGHAAEPVPRRARGTGSAVRGRGGSAPPLCGRRRPVARSRVGSGARVHRSAAVGGEDRAYYSRPASADEAFAGFPELHVGPLGRPRRADPPGVRAPDSGG